MPNVEPDSRAVKMALRALEIATVLLGLVTVVLFIWLVAARFVNPVDAEWMVGSVREQVARIREGQPVYGPPSASYIPFLYPPIYYWVSSLLARFVSVFVACKVVSLAATAGSAFAIFRVARSLGAPRFWSAIGVLLHFATYSLTLFFFDLERVDALAACFIVGGVALLLRGRMPLDVLGGVILGSAFFAKQPGLICFAAAVGGLFFARETKRAIVVLGSGGVAFAIIAAFLEATTSGWWRYYCVALPRTHGIEGALVTTFFVEDLPKAFTLAIASGAIFVAFARRALRGERSWRDDVFAAVLFGAMVASFSLRAHRGGWTNVILAWTPLACAAVAVAASRFEARTGATVRALLLAGVGMQMLGGMFDPNDTGPVPSDVRNAARMRAFVRDLEKDGEVIDTMAGDTTATRHFHAAAVFDVLRAGDRAPADYLEALAHRKYRAMIVGTPDETLCDKPSCAEVSELVQRNYFVALRLPEYPRTGMSGFDGRARWVLLPRKTPLGPLGKKELARRQRVEAGYADLDGWSRGEDAKLAPNEAIEELATNER